MWRDLWRAQRREWLAMRRVVIVILCVHVPIEGIRTLQGALSGLSPTQYLDANALQAVLLLGILSLYVLLDLSAFMMLFERHENRLVLAATLDALTSLLNRAGFMQLAERQRQRSAQDREPVSVLVMDLDLFKSINDTYGHDAGDAVICAFARCARAALRPIDLLSRPGGEEFWALLPNTDRDEASRIAQRVCDQFRGTQLQFEGRTIAATVSIGVARIDTERESIQAVLARADQALYEAKHEGRNRVSAAAPALAGTA
jgi:diguanylate cyclase (GGDEF)-like protein